MNESRKSSRRILVSLITVLVLIQVAILVYLWTLLRPPVAHYVAAPTQSAQEPWSAPAVAIPGRVQVTPGSAPGEAVVGPLVPATNYTARARAFDVEQALEHIAYLASDEVGGRQPGTPGSWAAGNYIAGRFTDCGLQPAGLDGSYFQTFTVPYGRITQLPVLSVTPPDGEVLTRTYAYRTDYRALTGSYLGAGEGEGTVVWLSDCLHDDYAGQDMVGKIVLCRFTGNNEVYRQAVEHQVGGLLLLDRETGGEPLRRGGYRETAWLAHTIPAYQISETLAEDLLVGTDYTLDSLSLRFTATPLSVTVHMAVAVEEEEEVEARNVLGLLPGSDPERSDEVVVIGAHYDHLGREPDGAVMNGANDNASGVATLLEIARVWQAQGFRPARSVLFAAWDGEEQGLLGSRYYVQNPTYPITRTVAMLNLDMVGAGEELNIDGEGAVATQLQSSAAVYGITNTITSRGRSDHGSFLEAGVPAAMLIWWPDVLYHTTHDIVQAVEPDKLQAVGVLSGHALAALAEGHIELERAVERLRASIAAGDREAFLDGVDPTNAGLQASQAAWFDNLWSRELRWVTIEPNRIRVSDEEALVTLRLGYRWEEAAGGPSVSYDVRFVQRNDRWYFAGYELDALFGDVVTVARFPEVPVGTRDLLSLTQETYLSIVSDLGLEPVTSTRVIYYPNTATMRSIARPAAARDARWLVPSAELAEISWGQPVTPALASLALNQMGLPAGEASWLREGLALHLMDGAGRNLLPVLASTDAISIPLDLSGLSGVPVSEVQALRAQAWSATDHLLERYGASGLRALCNAWGETGQADRAFQQALGLGLAEFDAEWRADRVEPLHADARAIEEALTARAEAVLSGDVGGFMDTIVSDDAVLRREERNWFDALADPPVVSYDLSGQIVEWLPREAAAVVDLTVTSVISGAEPSSAAYEASFIRVGDQWRYAGVDWQEIVGGHFVVKFQGHSVAWAQRVLDLAEEAYARVTADLGSSPPLPQEVKLYDDHEVFRTSVLLSLPSTITSWTGPGEAIRLWLGDGTERTVQGAIAHGLTHQVLLAYGMEAAWLREGIAVQEMGRATALGTHWQIGQHLPIVQDAVRRRNEVQLADLPLTVEDQLELEPEAVSAQTWSLVSFILESYGWEGLDRLITEVAASPDAVDSLQGALGVDPDTFWEDWRQYVYAGGVPEDLVALARGFDAERALEHIEVLASPEYGGRQAGSAEADMAATYIAEQFAALGLEPAADPLTETGELSYLQYFPVSYTNLISAPLLILLDAEGYTLHEFAYREDFLESGGEGRAEADLVWLQSDSLEGLYFGGAVVLEESVSDSLARAADLQAHGAGGLVVVTDRDADDLQTGHTQPSLGSGVHIPVVELTAAAFETLLERVGLAHRDLSTVPRTLQLGVRTRLDVERTPVSTTLAANVVGFLPGSDADLASEVIVVGAHYDHIGQSPEGLYFPGANRNASGVAVLLEMARVWREQEFRPARSVLFVAWGAEELGALDAEGAPSPSVLAYLTRPVVPLSETVGIVAVDSVGGGRSHRLLFYGTRENGLPLIGQVDAGATQLGVRVWRSGSTGEGWHTLFGAAGIPTVKFIWDRAEEGFYLPSDTVDNIEPDKLAGSGEVLVLTVSWLARR